MRDYLDYLRRLRDASLKDLTSDFKTRGAVERYLQVSIECVIDIGNEIISTLQLRRPERYRDIPTILAEAGIIPRELVEKTASMIGFRNILVHDYATVNLTLEHEFLQTRLPDLEAYMRHVAKWLKSRS